MLKRLELVGFKSFAEKTHFDFAPGITGIIGPNGSGKSNVVDAVRWVLGEQSAKSLRGGEMTDVIFNGSASRRSHGLAEVSMVFDNTKKVLATDADEVRITRRVYRSGEGEYLINNQPCRLKDIKDLFLGSGAGTDAYCIIQQGQVDILLQTAPKERRTIFEEAAGISRVKAKKVESQRKLDRVNADMQRLRDILDEVEKQFRSVKLQASKALKYQDYSERLKELRLGLSVREFHRLDGLLGVEGSELARLKAELESDTSRSEDAEREIIRLAELLDRLDAAAREQEAIFAVAKEQIGSGQAHLGHERSRYEQIEQEQQQSQQRLADLTAQVFALADRCVEARRELETAEAQRQEQAREVTTLEQELDASRERLIEIREEAEAQKTRHFDQLRDAGLKHNDAVSYRADLDNLLRERNRRRKSSELHAENLASLDVLLEQLTEAEQQVQQRLATARTAQAEQRAERDRVMDAREDIVSRAADLRVQRGGLLSRIEVLQHLERSHEGLGTGVREVIAHLQSAEPGPWKAVVGLVAHLLTVKREFAPLIELALGERAQRFLVQDAELLAQAMKQRGQPFSGRVSFFYLKPAASRPARPSGGTGLSQERGAVVASLGGHPGVVAPADLIVKCEDERFVDLPARLLGNTVIVRDLIAARALAALAAGLRFLTLSGELLEPDGTLTVGTHHAESGILSRKSELRDLRKDLVVLDERLAGFERDLADYRERIAEVEAGLELASREIDALNEQAVDLRNRISREQEKRDGLSEEATLVRSELGELEQEIERIQSRWEKVREEADEMDAAAATARARLEELEREARELETRRTAQEQQRLDAQISLTQSEERLAALTQRQERVEFDQVERQQELHRTDDRLGDLHERARTCEMELLRVTSVLATAYARKESAERLLRAGQHDRESARRQKQMLDEQMQASRSTWRTRQEAAHAKELEVNNLERDREALAARLREDYQIELEMVYQQFLAADAAWFSREPAPALVAEGEPPLPVDEAIIELKRRLAKLGSVNLESIEELKETEARHEALRTQFDDLTAAQKSLNDIIERINTDSRRLFTETFETIKGHFTELFRKLFGGGTADIVLEEGADILESGIEIVARPPGKELRSISLMSGGEKTMTAVALLMAIFRSRPSPFCILDEVDAALDEANVGRFTAVVRDFVDRSQFIIVTHHKRTMSAADVLYGVTMAESGVSSQMSVRFEDWPDDEKKQAA